jgi:Tol biopolymer transport system component/fibronectin type 3 domain-containing protein
VAIRYPKSGDPLPPGNIVEVKGTAGDSNFQSYALEAGQGETPAAWATVATGYVPSTDVVLGVWNTFGLTGKWTLRLSAQDKAGNKNSTAVIVDLTDRKTLVKSMNITPKIFSPNSDTKRDSALIQCDLTDTCRVNIDMVDAGGVIVGSHAITTASAGGISSPWNGLNSAGVTVADGAYQARLTATLTANPSISQTESLTVIVDTTAPMVDFKLPADKSYLNIANLSITGTISDQNLQSYGVTLAGASGVILQDSWSQSRTNHLFGTARNIDEGEYIFAVEAKDFGENVTNVNRTFIVDRTPPKATLDTPKDGDYIGAGYTVIAITGALVEKYLDRYSLRFGSGAAPTSWQELAGGNTLPASAKLYTWNVGKDDGVADGLYTVSLYAKDKAGLEGEARVKVIVDNTPPALAFSTVHDGDYIRGPIDIAGDLTDPNLDKGVLELATGSCATAARWNPLKNFTSSVSGGVLASWKLLPTDGDYCLRLSAIDKSGNSASATVSVKVAAHPPDPPVLSGKIDGKTNALLNWPKNTEADLAGYNVFRDGQKLNGSLLTDSTHTDINLKDGTYSYTVKAVNFAGSESSASNAVKLTIDTTGPAARITTPLNGTRVNDLVSINGTAFSTDDFKEYRIFAGTGTSPSSWSLIRKSPLPLNDGNLAQWDTTLLPEGVYSLKLEAEDLTGNVTAHMVAITVDNTPPAAPALLSVTNSGADAALSWRANTEADLAGYLVYRNGQLANGAGVLTRSYKPYQITGTTYLDKALPDGKYSYYLVAMDQAGNGGESSNSLSITIDTRPPHATITDPANSRKFDRTILVKAESFDNDIAAIQFQYKKVQDVAWTNLGAPVTTMPYVSYFDPTTLGLPFGDYHLTAIAIDTGGKIDPAPASITVTHTDLTPPEIPADLTAVTNGAVVTISWNANREQDLAGYNIYRTSGTTKKKINATPVNQPRFQDANLGDGIYTYEITAIDTNANESGPSAAITARVYGPTVTQPFTPVSAAAVSVAGYGAEPDATVEIYSTVGTVQTAVGTVIADAQGSFTGDSINLAPGENGITARAKDGVGNISRMSATVVVVRSVPPSAPTGLIATGQDTTVNLSWNKNPETDVAGYYVYRDGARLNTLYDYSFTATASSSAAGHNPAFAADWDWSTSWMSGNSPGAFSPAWLELDLPFAPLLVSRVHLYWLAGYVGRDFEIQAWSGSSWITLRKVTGNALQHNEFDIMPSYPTGKIRIFITATNCVDDTHQVGVQTARILSYSVVSQPAYQEQLPDGGYSYKIAAVNNLGFEGDPSADIVADVGDRIPPAHPLGLAATASGTAVALTWIKNGEPDMAGYHVYRKSADGWVKLTRGPVSASDARFVDQPLLNGHYRYRVTAVDAAGNESLPSDEAAAEVALVIPAPRNFRAAPASGEKGIDLMWDPPADTIDGYAIYRSLKSGGPYENLSQASLHGNSFRDTGIIPGTTYFYVVTARDTAGNESARSNEVSGVLPDSTPPNRPIVSYPTAPGMPVTLFASLADIAGMAEPGSRVELSRNNRSAGSSMATPHDIITSMDLPVGASYPVYTPDNQQVAYYLNQALWLKVIATGEAIQLMTPSGDNVSTWYPPAISPDGSKIIFEYLVSGWRHRIAVHDRNTGTTTTVTNDVDPYEWSAIWFRDSKRVAFASYQNGSTSLRIKNIETGELRILAEANNLDYLAISPDNKKIAYYEYPANGTWSLVVKDLESGGTLVTIDDTDGYLADWSPDNRRIAYMSGTGELHTIDIDTQEVRQLTASGSYKWSPTWSPDGKYIALAEYVQDRPYVLWIVDLNGNSRLIRDDLANISYLSWSSTGDLLCSTGTVSLSVTAAGTFKVKGVVLESGDNVITATAVDDSGRASLPSDAITVVLDTKLMPDTGIGGGDLTIYPAVPKTGEMVTVTAVVRNFSTIAVDNLPVVMYHWDAAGQLHLLKTEIVPHLTSQGSVEIYATIPAIPMTGNHSLIVMVDPENTINEILETNNSAIVGFTVTDREEVTLSTSLEALQYGANMNVSMHLAVRNSGSPAKGTLAVTVDDAAGTSAASIQRKAIIIPYGITEYRHDWNTGAFLAGSYQFHAVFTDDTGAVVESSTPFTILPDIRLDAHVITDKLDYGANEQVNLTLRITNKGSNYIAPHLTARLKIVDAGNTVLFADEKILENVLPAMVSSFSSRWKTGLSVPGTYDVIAEVYLDYKLVSSSSARFTITPVAHVNGAVAVNPAAVSFGSSFKAVYTVANSGNVLANGFIRAVIVDPETNSIITSTDQSTTIPVNGSLSGEFNFSSTGMRLHTYQMNAQFISKDGQKSIGSAGFTIKDVIPPNINVVSPIAGTTYYATISFTVRASDDASGLEAVEYQLDGGVWKPLPLEDPVNGRYAVAWNPSGTENGAHGVRFRATDKAGNSITSVSFPFTFQSVSKNPQTIAIFPMSATYGDADFAPGASASSGLPITYASGNPLVATVTANGLIHVVGTGSTTITATQEGNGSYLAAAAQQILTVAPALLTVTANNASRAIDAREPTFTASYSGFVKGETTAVLTGSPTFSTTAVATSPAGIYPITIGAGTLTSYNYRFRFVNGQLTISHSNSSVVDPTPADKTNQSISFAPLPSPVVHGCAPFTLSANATSGLEVTFSSSNGAVATISGATVTIKGVGTAIITASQSGNSNYNAAPDVTQTLTVLRDSTVPDLIVSTLSSGSLSGRPVVNVAGSASDPIGIAQVTVNGWPTPLDGDGGFSFPVFMTTGLNAITASADDNDGNRTTITRTITLDAAAPLLNLTSPADNSVTATADVTLSGNVGSSSIVVTYSLNGGESRAVTMSGVTFSANLTLEPGINTIEVTAVDLAGNKSSVKRTIILGKAFSLYLTDPDADLRTGRTSYLLKGKVANTTSPVTVTVTMDGITHTPPLIDGLFSQEIELGEERIYQVTVKAHDDNGSTVSVTRNFIYAQLGDSEGDGSLTIADALVAYLIRLGQRSATPADLTRLDVAPLESDGTPAGNGVIDVADVILILRHIVGLAPW